MGGMVLNNMFEVKYKLCKRAALTNSNKPIYYLAITNKEEVLKELDLHCVNIQYAETDIYILQIDVLITNNKVSFFKKTDIRLYKDLDFNEVLLLLEFFYKLNISDIINFKMNKEDLISIVQLIIAKWED
jgi:hypothetical protein